MCRELLGEAERDLNIALDTVEIPSERYFIEQHFDFLNRMKETSKKPDIK